MHKEEESLIFAAKLKEFRQAAGFSKSDLARHVGIDASYVSRLESGDRPPPRREIVLKIRAALSLNIDRSNELLLAADYAPIDIVRAQAEHSNSMKLLADILDDERIPHHEKHFVLSFLEQIQKRYLLDKED